MTDRRRGDVSDTSRPAGHASGEHNPYDSHTPRLLRRSRLIQRVTLRPSPSARAASLLAALVAALAVSGGASAATPCSEAILADWLDNSRIDHIYDLPCYEAAIDAIPHDLRDYTDAADVIARAFQNASGRRLERRLEGPSPTDPPPPGAVPAVDAAASTAVPVPLLVLGGMSVMLLAAGGFGYLSRRRREQMLDD
jgi:hypothetical protein